MKNKILLVLTMLLCIGYTNAQVSIKQVGGWFESAYLTWEHYTGADMYNVYVKEASSSTWTQLDKELIRNYGYYGRADMVGLAAGSYQFKIEATNGGTVIAGSEATSQSVTVKNYDRAGFAHLDGVAVGAYNNDGTLKSNARVLYIDNTNVDNVTLPILNGKTETTLTGLGEILKGYEKGLETRPLAVRFVGDINMTSSQLYGDADAMQLKGKANNIAMQVTFEGIGNDAYLSDWGLVLVKCNNVEVRNLGIML
ncbi:MAG: pectate lyase, partial [Bacteroidaceae bacterium]|nr:pectate lyase [Bacteroidaceae bacterium]